MSRQAENPNDGLDPGTDEGTDLLTSPLANAPVGKLFVIGGPLGLAVAIVVSLWVSYLHVSYTAVVQAPTQWVAGGSVGVRLQVVSETSRPVPDLEAAAWIEQAGARHELGELAVTPTPGLLHATLAVPALQVGEATLHIEAADVDERATVDEEIAVSIVERAARMAPQPLVAGSTLQHGDDSDPQPPAVRIVVRPRGRLLSEFNNELFVRVTHPDGRPYVGEVEVALVSGTFAGERGSEDTPPVLARGALDALGLLSFSGRLTSDVVRFEARVLRAQPTPTAEQAPAEPAEAAPAEAAPVEDHALQPGDAAGRDVLHRRRLRMVSFAGGIVVEGKPLAVPRSEPALELAAEALRSKHPVFVDVHDASGQWVSTLTPPLRAKAEPTPWTRAALDAGIVQFEAYHFTNDPGESTALARVQVVDGDPSTSQSVAPLVAAYRAGADQPRTERDYDAVLERAYADAVAKMTLTPAQVASARRYFLGTLPLSTWGPPVALINRDRELAAMADKKQRWTVGMRWFLLGGGGAFLLLMTLAMMRTHARAAAMTMTALRKISNEEERKHAARVVAAAKRAALLRGLGVIGVMAASLVLATVMLESLLWSF